MFHKKYTQKSTCQTIFFAEKISRVSRQHQRKCINISQTFNGKLIQFHHGKTKTADIQKINVLTTLNREANCLKSSPNPEDKPGWYQLAPHSQPIYLKLQVDQTIKKSERVNRLIEENKLRGVVLLSYYRAVYAKRGAGWYRKQALNQCFVLM